MSDPPYRESGSGFHPPDPWLLAWAELRRRRRALWIGIALLAATIAVAWYRHFDVWWACLLMGAATAVFAERCNRFACPRCGKWFSRRGLFHNESTSRCLHCGLKIGTPKGP
jgi:hypothetical protein